MNMKLYKITDINKPYITEGGFVTVINNTPVIIKKNGYCVSVRTIFGYSEKIIEAKNAREAKKEFIRLYPPFG